MKLLIVLVFFINMFILLYYYMHMLQLSSYFFKKYMHWVKNNYLKIFIEIIVTFFALVLFAKSFYILSLIVFSISIFYNFPKHKAKIELKITNRVKRMFFTELLIILLLAKFYSYTSLLFLNLLTPFMCIIANFINFPIEYTRKVHYIKQAKKILNDMPNLIVIGVTGSYGKTSVKNFLSKILETKYEVLTTPKNYNTTMGIVKTIRTSLKSTHQIFICEMGATKPNDIKEICDIVRPKIGIITSIGPQHLESFKTIEAIINTKFELAQSVRKNNGTMFLNFDNNYIARLKIEQSFITYGTNNLSLNYNALNIKTSSKGSTFEVLDKTQNKKVNFHTHIIGKHNVVNIMGAIAVSNYLGISLNDTLLPIKKLTNNEHRLSLISNNNLNIIDDSYNSNPISSKSAILTLSEFEGTKIIVTPGLIELGKDEKKYNFELGKFACNVCDYIFLVNSKQVKAVSKGIFSTDFNKNNVFNVKSPEDAIKRILNLNIKGKVNVLLENDLPDNY